MKTETIFYKKGMMVILFILLLCYPWIGYAADYRGEYGGISKDGIMVTITLGDNGQAMTNIWGIPISAEYKISFGKITLTASVLGTKRTIQGRIEKDSIQFADIVLKKGVNESQLLYDMLGMNDQEDDAAKDTEIIDEVTENSPYAKYDEAERLFSLGHYQEAIALYDEIADEVDVEERRNYAAECLDYCDMYFTVSYRYSDSDVSKGLMIEKYTGYGMETVSIPYGVCGIASRAFSDNNSFIKTMILSETVREIETSALEGCCNLAEINIPPSLKKLALNGTGIQRFVVPKTVEKILDRAFENCEKLREISFEGEVQILGGDTFKNCKNLYSVGFPLEIKSIPNSMFDNCTGLSEVCIPDTVTEIGSYVFNSCRSLQSVQLPDSVEAMGREVFRDCSSLKEIILPPYVKTIREQFFKDCISLNYVHLPDQLEKIEGHVFSGCTNLRALTIPKKVKEIGDIFNRFMDNNDGLILYVTKGTYGHRFAEESQIKYSFDSEPDVRTDLFRLGRIISFGNYEQNNNLEDGREKINWYIIGQYENMICMISECILDYRPAFEKDYMQHDGSTIQRWLQNTFFREAFTDQEQNIIQKIDLLSLDEVQKYMPSRVNRNTTISDYALSHLVEIQGFKNTNAYFWWLKDAEITTYYFPYMRKVCSLGGYIEDEYYVSFRSENCMAGIRPGLWIDKGRLQQMLTGDTIEITAPEIHGNDMTDNIVNEEPTTLVANEETEKTSEMTEALLQEQQDDGNSGLITKSGKATGAAGGQIIATVVVENGVILSCSIDDENATEQMREGYDFCMKALEGKTCASVIGGSKKKLTNDVRDYMQGQGYTFTSGSYTHKAIVDGIQAIRVALE